MEKIKTKVIIGIFIFFGLLCLYDIALSEPSTDYRINQLQAEIEKAKSTWTYHNGIVAELNYQIMELEKRRDEHQAEKKKVEDLAEKNRAQIVLLQGPKNTPNIQAKNESQSEDYDVVSLCQAIAAHETASCTKGVGPTHNNCIGIKRQGSFVRYDSPEDSLADCQATWSKYYGRFPDLRLAKIWSGNDRPEDWLTNVTVAYYTITDQK